MSVTAEDFEEFDEYEDEDDEGGISGFSVLLVILTVLAVFALIVFFAYRKGINEGAIANGAVTTVAADPRPAKTEIDIAAAGSGNREVFDALDGNTPSEVIATADPLEGFDDTTSAAAQVAANKAEAAVAAVTEPVEAPKPKPKPAAKPTPTEPVVAPAVIPKPSQGAPVQTSTSGPALSGSHVVQVGAFRSNDEANRFFNQLSTKMGTLVSRKSSDVQVADLGAKGVYYRLRIGPFASKSAAADYCGTLKTRGQDCLVKAK